MPIAADCDPSLPTCRSAGGVAFRREGEERPRLVPLLLNEKVDHVGVVRVGVVRLQTPEAEVVERPRLQARDGAVGPPRLDAREPVGLVAAELATTLIAGG